MNNIEYISLHKCRMCGEVIEKSITSDKNLIIQSMVEMETHIYTIPQAPRKTDIHFYDNGNIGMCDFIGWKKREKEEETPISDEEFPF